MRFVFPDSHAFRRGRLAIDDEGNAGPECLVEFGDGVTVIAEWRAGDDTIRLSVPDYRTAKGTLVTARSWRVARGHDGLWRTERLS